MDKLSVVVITKSRTRLCKYAIKRLAKYFEHPGYSLHYIISCDSSSDEHKKEIENQLIESGIDDYEFICTPDGMHGAMNNYNNGVKRGLEVSEFVFHIEDDWILEKPLDITRFISVMKRDDSVLKIRLGWIQNFEKTRPYDLDFNEVIDKDWAFNTQVGLVSRKTHSVLGYFIKNEEKSLSWKANEIRNSGKQAISLIPNWFKANTFDDKSLYFTHAGKSECGAPWVVPERYLYLNGSGKIIVSMTSYPGRIRNVGKSIHSLFRQSVPPDEVHLWLSVPEFPSMENGLPSDLLEELKSNKVTLHWLPKNTFCHKRHEIFKSTNENDCVFFIDDDVYYNERLIETVLNDHEKYPNAIITYNDYDEHLYEGTRILYKNAGKIKGPSVRIRFCGQSMIPSRIYPKFLLDERFQAIRDKICPIEDETWLTPWLVYAGVPIYCEHFGWGIDIDPIHARKELGLVLYTHQKESNGMERRDNWLAAVLNEFPSLKQKYIEMFGYGG